MYNTKNEIFNKPITEIIKDRISVRSYEPKLLDEDLKKQLINYMSNLESPFNGKTRLKLIDSKASLDRDIKLGTYGVIKGASSFVGSAVKAGDMGLEELGYKLESFILYATSLGLGTCWLGGTFKKGEFSKALDLKEDEILPIVTPIGYKANSKSIVEKLMRTVAGSNNRKKWDEIFFNTSFDEKLTDNESKEYAEALEMVRLAPSASNKQPWRIVKDKEKLHFYIYHAKGYSNALGFDMQRIDIGIAMCHLELTLKETGVSGKWQKIDPSIKVPNENIEYIISWVK